MRLRNRCVLPMSHTKHKSDPHHLRGMSKHRLITLRTGSKKNQFLYILNDNFSQTNCFTSRMTTSIRMLGSQRRDLERMYLVSTGIEWNFSIFSKVSCVFHNSLISISDVQCSDRPLPICIGLSQTVSGEVIDVFWFILKQ